MRHSLFLGLIGLALLLVPSRAEAQWSLRLALEAPLYVHTSSNGQSSSYGINDSFQPTVDLIGSYFLTWVVAVDLELRTGIAATGTGYSRQRTALGPGLTFDDPTFPLYGRVSFPIQVESSVVATVRAGGGLKILDMAFLRLYFEVTADFPIAGSGVSFFSSQAVNGGLGVWLRL